MRKRLILIAALPLSISLKPLAAQNEKIFIIDKQTVYQEIDNFSASDAWRCAFIGKNWPQEKKEKIADLLFKREFDKKGNPIGMALTNMPGRSFKPSFCISIFPLKVRVSELMAGDNSLITPRIVSLGNV